MNEYNEKTDSKLAAINKQKDELDRTLLKMEVWLGIASVAMFIALAYIAYYMQMQEQARILIITISTIFLVIVASFMLKIEQIAGYYKCKNCEHRYVPKYSKLFLAMHIGIYEMSKM